MKTRGNDSLDWLTGITTVCFGIAVVGISAVLLAQSLLGLLFAIFGALVASIAYEIKSIALYPKPLWNRKEGQTALLVFILLFALIALVFWNWEYVNTLVPSGAGLPSDFGTQLIIIFAVLLIILVSYAIYLAKKPKI